jgi:hypothetical protein
MMASKMLIAMYVIDCLGQDKEYVFYNIYKDNQLKLCTHVEKDARGFYAFMLARHGKPAIRLEIIKV